MISRTRTQVDWLPKSLAENSKKGPKNELFHSKNLPEWDQILPKLNIFALQSHQSHHPTQTGQNWTFSFLAKNAFILDRLAEMV